MPIYYDPDTGRPISQDGKQYYDPDTGRPVGGAVAEKARANLKNKLGTTPEAVKAGGAPVAPAPSPLREGLMDMGGEAIVGGAKRFGQNLAGMGNAVVQASLAPARNVGALARDVGSGNVKNALVDVAEMSAIPMSGISPRRMVEQAEKVRAGGGFEEGVRGLPVVGEQAITLKDQIKNQDIGGFVGDLATAAVVGKVMKGKEPTAPGATPKPSGGVISRMREAAGRRVMDAELKPADADLKFNADPTEGAKGIVSITRKGTDRQLTAKIDALDAKLAETLADPQYATPTINIRDVVSGPVSDAIQMAKRTGGDAAVARLERLQQAQIDDAMSVTQGRDMITPAEAQTLKRRTGELIRKWSEDPAETATTAVLQEIYRAYDAAIDDIVPKAAPLNKAMQNAITARNANARQMRANRRQDLSINPLRALDAVVNSTPARTGLAKVLSPRDAYLQQIMAANPIPNAQPLAPLPPGVAPATAYIGATRKE